MKLNVGCGKDIMDGWVNMDIANLIGVDLVADVEDHIPLEDSTVDEFYLSHLIEHIENPLIAMEELYWVAKPDAKMTIRCPYGSSDDAWEDPTHKRPYFLNSFGYFSQPFYWRADYHYRADWKCEEISLLVKPENKLITAEEVMYRVNTLRNQVIEMTAVLTCIKPAREPLRELQTPLHIKIVVAE